MAKELYLKVRNETPESAIITIEGEIGENWWSDTDMPNTLARIRDELAKIDASKVKNIIVNIHSLGGDVDEGLAIYDLLIAYNCKIKTSLTGMCASAATVIAMAGNDREMSDNGLMLPHRSSSYASGNLNQIQQTIDMLKAVDERIINIYMRDCKNKTRSEIEALMDKNVTGTWITAQEALDYGFITAITHTQKKSACCTMEKFKNSKLPALPSGYEFLIENDEKSEDSFFKKVKKYIDDVLKYNKNHQILTEMKNFPLICALLALALTDTIDKDKGVAFTEDQLKKIEDEFARIKAIEDENTRLKNEATQKDNTISTHVQKISELNNTIKNLPANHTKHDGQDTLLTEAKTITEYISGNSFYAEKIASIGKKIPETQPVK